MNKNKIYALGAVLLLLCFCWTGFQRDNHNFQVSKNLDVFNSVYKELDQLQDQEQ